MSHYLRTLREMRERAMQGGGTERIAQQHAKGKMTARERLALLLDEETFQELGALATHNITDFGMDKQRFPGDGVVTGFGRSTADELPYSPRILPWSAAHFPRCSLTRSAASRTSPWKAVSPSSA